jgi:Raf kinase inhibitor-like YbhB/YbcL family protein
MIFLSSCGGDSQGSPTAPGEAEGAKMALDVRSSAFEEGGPNGTRGLVLIVDDPDAPRGAFVHWVIYNLPPDTRRLPEDVPNQRTLPSGALQGMNGAGSIGYIGPCPPSGTHRYFFKVYALDTDLDLVGGATKEDVVRTMEGHVLAEGRLRGTYQRG